MEFQKEKYAQVMYYIIDRYKKLPITDNILNCILYLTDFNHYELYEHSLTGEKYKLYHLPVGVHFDDVLNSIIQEGLIGRNKKDYSLVTKEWASLGLSIDVLNNIDDVISKLSSFDNEEDMMEYILNDMPCRVYISDDNNYLDYEFVFYRNSEYVVREYPDDDDD